MKTRLNPIPAGSLQAFANIHSRLHQGVQQVSFVRAVGVSRTLSEEITRMDAQLSADANTVYRRIDRLPDLPQAQQDAFLQRAAAPPTAFADAFAQIRVLLGQVTPPLPDAMQKTLFAQLLYRAEQTLTELTAAQGSRFCKLVLTAGSWQEYLFGETAALLGIDTLVLMPAGDSAIPAALLRDSVRIALGPSGVCVLPPYRPQSSQNSMRVQMPQSQPPQNNQNSVRVQMPQSQPPQSNQNSVRVQIPRSPQQPSDNQNHTRPQTAQNLQNSVRVQVPRSHYSQPPQQHTVRTAEPPAPRPSVPMQRRVPEPQELPYEALAALASSVVMIGVHDSSGEINGSGSGIVIGREGYILTNCHVVEGSHLFSVRIENDNQVYRAYNVIKYHTQFDLAVIRIERELMPLMIYDGRRPLARGQHVVAIGSPMGLFNSVSDGIISGFREVDGREMIQFTAPISSGSSGGALLNTCGEVIGLCTAGVRSGQNLNLAVDYTQILAFARNFITP